MFLDVFTSILEAFKKRVVESIGLRPGGNVFENELTLMFLGIISPPNAVQGFIRINSTRLKAYNSLRGCPASLKTDL